MSIFQAPPAPVSTLPAYNDAVNASRFVKGFGIAVLAYSFLLFLGLNLLASGIGIGTGLFYRLALHEHPAFRHFDGRPPLQHGTVRLRHL